MGKIGMVKISLGLLSFAAGFVILGLVISAIGAGEIAGVFLQFSPWGFIPLFVLTVIIHIVSALKWQYLLRTMGIRVPLIPLTKIWLAGYAVSYITPVVYIGGEFFRAYALRERYGVPWARALSSIFIDKSVEAAVWITVILAGAAVLISQSGTASLSKAIAVSLVSILVFGGFLAVIYIFSFRKKSLVHFWFTKVLKSKNSTTGKFLGDIEKDFFVFFSAGNKAHILGVTRLALLKYGLLLVRNILLLYYLVGALTISGSIVGLGFSYLSFIAPIPGAIGAQEGLLSLVFARIGFEAGTGTVFTLLLRAAEVVMVGFGLYFLARWGMGKIAFRVTQWAKNGLGNGKET